MGRRDLARRVDQMAAKPRRPARRDLSAVSDEALDQAVAIMRPIHERHDVGGQLNDEEAAALARAEEILARGGARWVFT